MQYCKNIAYCLNNPINDKDPTGELGLWGALEYAYRTVESIEAYYGALDFALSTTGDPADMLEWLPELNDYREFMFSDRRLNRQFNWEAYLGTDMQRFLWKVLATTTEGLLQGMEIINNTCDWLGLSGCIMKNISDDAQAFSACGLALSACIADPEPVTRATACVALLGCGIYFAGECVVTNCPNPNPVDY